MTFKQFNAINDIIKQGKTVVLRMNDDEPERAYNVVEFDENSSFSYVEDCLETFSEATVFAFDGDFYSEVKL